MALVILGTISMSTPMNPADALLRLAHEARWLFRTGSVGRFVDAGKLLGAPEHGVRLALAFRLAGADLRFQALMEDWDAHTIMNVMWTRRDPSPATLAAEAIALGLRNSQLGPKFCRGCGASAQEAWETFQAARARTQER